MGSVFGGISVSRLLLIVILSSVTAQQTCQCQNGGDTIEVSGETDAEAEAAALEQLQNRSNAMMGCFLCPDGVSCSLDPNENPCFELIITTTLFGQSLGTLTCTEQNEMLSCDAQDVVTQNNPTPQSSPSNSPQNPTLTPTPSNSAAAQPSPTTTSRTTPASLPTSSASSIATPTPSISVTAPLPSSLPSDTPTLPVTLSAVPSTQAKASQIADAIASISSTPTRLPIYSPVRRRLIRRTAISFGDPHVYGFDGTHFDFHGRPGRYYAMFGVVGSELLTTRLRSSRYHLWNLGITKTYFDEFGLTVSDGSRVHISLIGNSVLGWSASVYVDDKVMESGSSYTSEGGGVEVSKDRTGMEVQANTSVATYTFNVVQAKEERHHHLNVKVEVASSASAGASAEAGGGARVGAEITQYVGVLGMTMNHANNFKVDPVLHTEKHTRTTGSREKAMRKYFGVESLFPPMQNVTPHLGGITARFRVVSRTYRKIRRVAILEG